MNIFNLPLEEAEKEIEEMIKSVPREQLIQDLKECGLMNKQDKKEIMNLIKYKKMLGGRRMSLEKAIKELKNICAFKEEIEALNVVLSELDRLQKSEEDLMIKAGKIACEMSLKLDERYNKGYQDGFKQAKFDCEMDKLDGR